MRQFPAFFNMTGAHVVVFGGGEEARRKVRLLASTEAVIAIITERPADPAFIDEFDGRAEFLSSAEADHHLKAARFAIIAPRNPARIDPAITLSRQHGLAINVVDRPELCDFTVPAIVDRGEIVAAIGSGGAAPVLAKIVRQKLEALLPARMGELASLARRMRPAVKMAIADSAARRRFWERALSGKAADLAYAGDLRGAEAEMFALLDQDTSGGIVHIVGAGPGDPELLTLKALRVMQEADIVYYDRLVSDEILALIRRDADRIPVGKSKGDHSVPQGQIQELMIASARQGKRVVRLKGGDPFVFGRGGEELDAVLAAGLEAFVVPGISSALGCAASAGVPLTHRDHAQSVTFVTGHAKQGGVPDLDWGALSRRGQTAVVFMGVGTAPEITDRLIEAGRGPDTPVCVVENGTRPNEIIVRGLLAALPDLIADNGIQGPALLIIGEVAALGASAKLKRVLDEVTA